jgi:hypothetical protein
MPTRIRDDQIQLCNRVFQIVHHECGQSIIGFELTALGELAIGRMLRKVCCDMSPDCL